MTFVIGVLFFGYLSFYYNTNQPSDIDRLEYVLSSESTLISKSNLLAACARLKVKESLISEVSSELCDQLALVVPRTVDAVTSSSNYSEDTSNFWSKEGAPESLLLGGFSALILILIVQRRKNKKRAKKKRKKKQILLGGLYYSVDDLEKIIYKR
jgi:hypothetical protein